MLEYWDGALRANKRLRRKEGSWGGTIVLSYYPNIPLFHHSIIPVLNLQNGWLGILYYQQFVEFPRHLIIPVHFLFFTYFSSQL
jgi:hypothetical protein